MSANDKIDASYSVGHSDDVVDLRSDTVTRPTEAMYRQMRDAPVGDDGLDGDPTARKLEGLAADLLGQEAGLFVPSCTMANLLAIMSAAERSEQVLLESQSHIYCAERGGATLTGSFYLPIHGNRGEMDIAQLEDALRGNSSRVRSALVCLETSHNNAGGTVPSLSHIATVSDLGRRHGALIHLDGARLFNAAVALGRTAAEIGASCDTVSLCLSKGLSAPTGALLVGSRERMDRARSIRRMIGGQQRQVGVVAAAGIEALTTMPSRLLEDHSTAALLAELLTDRVRQVTTNHPETNIVQVDVSSTGKDATSWAQALAAEGLLVRPWRGGKLRCVTHRHINAGAIEIAVAAFERVAASL